jgi:dTDP-glucose pyrophosphorylase/molybdopterin-guanine dinucleotide biosynthesis protein A
MSGVGQRFIDVGFKTPKPLIKILGKPIIQHVIEMYPGWDNILLIVNSDQLKDKSMKLVETINNFAPFARIHAITPHKLGPTHAVYESREFLIEDGPIVINYCDFAGIFNLDEFENKIYKFDSVLLTYTGFHPHMARSSKYAYLQKKDEEFCDIQEKQSYTLNPAEEEASAGAYSFINKKILMNAIEYQKSNNLTWNGEFYTSLTVKALFKQGFHVESTIMSKFFQWGTPEDLEDFMYWMESISEIRSEINYGEPIKNNVILLAGGKGSRVANIVNKPKPFIPVTEKLLWEESIKAKNFQSRSNLVVRHDLLDLFNSSVFNTVTTLSHDTRGQADSALAGLKSITNDDPVSVLSSDCVLPKNFVTLAVECLQDKGFDILVWTADKYPPSISDPSSFSWVLGDNEISKLFIKEKPILSDEILHLVTGNFTFKNVKSVEFLIEKIMQEDLNKTNSEFYLDSVINVALKLGLKVGRINVPHFFSLGTPLELRSFEYWKECIASFARE